MASRYMPMTKEVLMACSRAAPTMSAWTSPLLSLNFAFSNSSAANVLTTRMPVRFSWSVVLRSPMSSCTLVHIRRRRSRTKMDMAATAGMKLIAIRPSCQSSRSIMMAATTARIRK